MKHICYLFLASLLSISLFASGYKTTGKSVRIKRVFFKNFRIYQINHWIDKDFNYAKPKELIFANVNKYFTLKMLRTLKAQRILKPSIEVYESNNFHDRKTIRKAFKHITGELKKGEKLQIYYNAKNTSTTFSFRGKKSVIYGKKFMQATWACWFANTPQPSMRRQLSALR
ncbi:MAG: chalcone isomerase family protein [Spirochaetota bacterium]